MPGSRRHVALARRGVLCSVALTLAVAGALAGWPAVPALGWSNGPDHGNGFGTHDGVLYQADREAAAQGYDWLEFSVAQPVTDDPDTVYHDFVNHVYQVVGRPYGSSPTKVASLFSEAVDELRRGDRPAASRTFGLLSHYYSDTCQPLHTEQTTAEKKVHAPYESAVDRSLRSPADGAQFLQPHKVVPVTAARASTIAAAETANRDYSALVAEYSARRFDPVVEQITARSLDHAVSGLADLIAGASVAAGVARAPTSVSRARSRGSRAPGADASPAANGSAVDASAGEASSMATTTSTVSGGAVAAVLGRLAVGCACGFTLLALLTSFAALFMRRKTP